MTDRGALLRSLRGYKLHQDAVRNVVMINVLARVPVGAYSGRHGIPYSCRVSRFFQGGPEHYEKVNLQSKLVKLMSAGFDGREIFTQSGRHTLYYGKIVVVLVPCKERVLIRLKVGSCSTKLPTHARNLSHLQSFTPSAFLSSLGSWLPRLNLRRDL